MTINLKYFGLIAEITQKTEETINSSVDKLTLASLKQDMETLYHPLKNIDYSIAINQELAALEQLLQQNDEVAFLPPFAGG